MTYYMTWHREKPVYSCREPEYKKKDWANTVQSSLKSHTLWVTLHFIILSKQKILICAWLKLVQAFIGTSHHFSFLNLIPKLLFWKQKFLLQHLILFTGEFKIKINKIKYPIVSYYANNIILMTDYENGSG